MVYGQQGIYEFTTRQVQTQTSKVCNQHKLNKLNFMDLTELGDDLYEIEIHKSRIHLDLHIIWDTLSCDMLN